MVEEKKISLERLTIKQYEELLISNIKIYRGNLKIAEEDLESSIDSYRTFLYDKNNYRIECYKKGDRYIYKKFARHIGFRK